MGVDVLFYVQHLLGTGHLQRAALIARAMADAGLDVRLVTGGPPAAVPLAGIAAHRLPAVRSRDIGFSALVDDSGREIDDRFRARRRDELLALHRQLRPRALIIETFPFGRRQMRFELLPLLDQAWASSPRPLVLSSIRDILQRRTADRDRETLGLARERFDRVLVHGDPAFVTLDESFPPAAGLGERIVYTGVVAADIPEATPATNPVSGEILVSAGGGAVGRHLYPAAITAATGAGSAWRWRLLVSPAAADDEFRRLVVSAPANVAVERNRPDFRALLGGCLASVSQAGYNTVADIVGAGARAVLVPFVGAGGETEQTLRARRLVERGWGRLVGEDELDGERLAQALQAVLALPWPPPAPFRTDGAVRTAGLIGAWLGSGPCR